MNCTVCGNPLIYDRAVFHCSCGAFIHAYCWDEHVLQAHRPSFEIDEQASKVQASGEQSSEEQKTPLLG
jgi:hypothetical protein